MTPRRAEPRRGALASWLGAGTSRLAICALASVAGHLGLAHALDRLPARVDPPPAPRIVEVRVIAPPVPAPPPEPVAPPEPVKPVPAPKLYERPKAAAPAIQRDAPPVDTPPLDTPPLTTDTTTTPTFGVTMASTSQAGTGPAMPVGNTTRPAPTGAPGAPVKPLAAPVAAAEVTKMPLPQGRCAGKYNPEALAAGVEGVVVLDLTVDERGRARDITVVQGLAGGLTAAAIAAVTACPFSPGERNGVAVAVRVREFKVNFVLPDPP
jgi:periplasmic protein TonB